MQQPFEHPEIKKLLDILIESLFKESGRGAILIATPHIEQHLKELIETMLPKEYSRNQKNKIFNYPGSLSSFSAKIELAYAFRLIGEQLYKNLSAFRKLRNDAAHKTEDFELHELNDRLAEIFNMGQDIPRYIREISASALIESKLTAMYRMMSEFDLTEDEKQKQLRRIMEEKEGLKMLEKQLPFWELMMGVCLLCWLIIINKEKISSLMEGKTTIANLYNHNRDSIK